MKIDLSEYAGMEIFLRFRIVTNSSITNDGWYIDDISITENTATTEFPFFDDMETAASRDNWLCSSWQKTNAKQHSGLYSFTDSLKGSHSSYVYPSLTLAGTIDLTTSHNPYLTFWHRYRFYRYAWVYISENGGRDWIKIEQYSGTQNEWSQVTLNLSAYKNSKQVLIRFRSEADCGYDDGGWYIDDVAITEDPSIPTLIKKTSEDNQIGETGTALPQPLAAGIYDSYGNTRAEIPVTFEVTSGGGSLSVTKIVSDLNGMVSSILTLGSDPGANTVIATIDGTDQTITFSATGYNADVAVRMEKLSGDNQVAEVNNPLPNSFIVKVTDVRDDPMPGITVSFSIISGSGSLSHTEIETDSRGIASSRLTLGADPETVTVSATSTDLIGSPASFIAHAVLAGGCLGDMDGDNMPDEWETKHGFNPKDLSDAAQDADSDDLKNIGEYVNGTDPNASDTDSDNMPDGWEVSYGLDPNDPSDAFDDNDGDGATNLEEYNAGTAPVSPRHFRIAGVTDNSIDFYGNITIDGVSAETGDEVAMLDPDGVVCGRFTVETPGMYGFMHVYKDDPNTSAIDEGAEVEDELTFRIWDASAGAEIDAAVNVVTGVNPPVWTFDGDLYNVDLNGTGIQNIPLHEGWNLVSFSVKTCFYADGVADYEDGPPDEAMLPGIAFQKVESIADALASIDGQYDVVRSFDSMGAHTYDPALPDFSDMKYMAAGYGYWIKMNGSGNLKLNGVRAIPSDTLELSNGWNLVGFWRPDACYTNTVPLVDFPSDVKIFTLEDSIDEILSSIRNNYDVIRSYDINGAHTYDPFLGGFNDLDYLGSGYGFWIKMKSPGMLSY